MVFNKYACANQDKFISQLACGWIVDSIRQVPGQTHHERFESNGVQIQHAAFGDTIYRKDS
jgi:hypothetical protein